MSARLTLSAAVLATLLPMTLAPVAPARAQQDLAHISCADYLKAEHGSDWSNGVTGTRSMNQQSTSDATKTHDFCASHPDAMAAEASGGHPTPN